MTIGATIGIPTLKISSIYSYWSAEAVLGYAFTDVDSIYSQLHGLSTIPATKLPHVVSISYGEITLPGGEVRKRRVNIPHAPFTEEQDPTRFLSYHCLIHPMTSWCKEG
jgi:fringe protein